MQSRFLSFWLVRNSIHNRSARVRSIAPDAASPTPALGLLAADLGATSVVLGLPLLLNGDEGPAAVRARTFGERLSAETSLPVTMWDERLTTARAERDLIASGAR